MTGKDLINAEQRAIELVDAALARSGASGMGYRAYVEPRSRTDVRATVIFVDVRPPSGPHIMVRDKTGKDGLFVFTEADLSPTNEAATGARLDTWVSTLNLP